MTGVEAEQEFDFDFLFEFKHSDESGGGGGFRRGGRGTSGGAGGGMLPGALPCAAPFGGAERDSPPLSPGREERGVGRAPGCACRPRRDGKRRAVPRRPGGKSCPGALFRGVRAAPGRACKGGRYLGGSRYLITVKLGDRLSSSEPRVAAARRPAACHRPGCPRRLPGAGGGRPPRTALTAPRDPGPGRWKWRSWSCPLQSWAGSKGTSASSTSPESWSWLGSGFSLKVISK